MSDRPDTDDAPKTPLPLSILGLVAACSIAVWAGVHYMTNDASLFYGLLAGLSFGATFAFGQQIKNRFVPPKQRKTDWRVQAPGAAELSPAKLAAQAARKISVEFDEQEIRTMVRGAKREGIAWSDVGDVTIRISDGPLPQPEWIIAGQVEGAVKGVLVPNDAEGLDQLQDAMKQKLPGFDDDKTYETVIAAMSAMEGSFHLWRRQPA
ncbi:anaphase-promoting protein [Herbaspirillum sp. LeCh32-8]|uniref:anaphase-promoting protein n=1 Tax=Herbaspirillum sp. LeCh32-8 TaxID=2821356 RepID=UPI001AE1F0F0|nr:anaphase-promoting protein [Herbaspirillum sp. LeCh32-8]MBP0596833.1 anaphase-promoting protein [Herbaspirillum sp. LeCh32-8]